MIKLQMKQIVLSIAALLIDTMLNAQTLSDHHFKLERRKSSALGVNLVSKRISNCLYDWNRLCTYGDNNPGYIDFQSVYPEKCIVLKRNLAGYCPGVQCDYDSLVFEIQSDGRAKVSRTEYEGLDGKIGNLSVIWKKSYESLISVDTLYFEDRRLIRRVFRNDTPDKIKITVYQSKDDPQVIYYFAGHIGLIKIVNPARWDSSYYLIDTRKKCTLELTSGLNEYIKLHYPDPHWLEVFPTEND